MKSFSHSLKLKNVFLAEPKILINMMKVYDSLGNWFEYFGRQVWINTQNLELGFCENGEVWLCVIRIKTNPVHLFYIRQL
jgi:hypothetical protein